MKLEIPKGHKKGQAVMEYLVTYGLALFVILIVLAILVTVVLPSLRAPETCQFTQPGFGCSQKQHVIVADSASELRVLFELDNEQGKEVIVKGVLCSVAAASNIDKADVPDFTSDITLAAGASKEITALCYNEDGTTRAVLSPNSNFRGSIALKYNFRDEVSGAPERLAVATVAGTVQSE